MSTAMQDLVRHLEVRRGLPSPEKRRRIRKTAGVSLGLLAGAVGVSRQTLALWESGSVEPRGKNLEAYVAALRTLEGTVAA
jgi:transcriptional regulator with XRE-family HTH domain